MTFYRSDRERNGKWAAKQLEDIHGTFTSVAARIRRQSPLMTTLLTNLRNGMTGEYNKLVAFRSSYGVGDPSWFSTKHGAEYQTALDGAIASMQAINTAFNAGLAPYEAADGNVKQMPMTPGDQNTVATAIEAELEA